MQFEKKFQGGGVQYCFDKHVERNDISFVFRALTIIACKALKYNLPIDFKFHNCYEKCHLTKQIVYLILEVVYILSSMTLVFNDPRISSRFNISILINGI